MAKTPKQTAEEKFAKAKSRDDAVLKERQVAEQKRDAKVERLRGLRLAKEAADREAAAQAKAEKPARKHRKKEDAGAEPA